MKEAYQISVIVPVYNGQEYLERALNSLTRQTIFEKLQIIVVDDGSTDESGSIMDAFSRKYSNILPYHIPNGGVSSARNYGMERACGAYIGFLDGDDWLDPVHFEAMLSSMERTGADMAACGFVMESDNGRFATNCISHKVDSYFGQEAVKAFLVGQMDVHAVTKLYRASLIQDVRFEPAVHYGEDRLFVLDALLQAHQVVIVRDCFYHYYLNAQSAMHQPLSEKSFGSLFVGSRTVSSVAEKYPELLPYAQCEEISTKCRLLGDIVLQKKEKAYAPYYQQLKNEIRAFDLAKAHRYSSRKHFMSLLLARISPWLYGKLRSVPHLRFHQFRS